MVPWALWRAKIRTERRIPSKRPCANARTVDIALENRTFLPCPTPSSN